MRNSFDKHDLMNGILWTFFLIYFFLSLRTLYCFSRNVRYRGGLFDLFHQSNVHSPFSLITSYSLILIFLTHTSGRYFKTKTYWILTNIELSLRYTQCSGTCGTSGKLVNLKWWTHKKRIWTRVPKLSWRATPQRFLQYNKQLKVTLEGPI